MTNITIPRALLEQALEALEDASDHLPKPNNTECANAADALTASLSQAETAEPQPMPWLTGSLAGWSIVGMNHYRMHGRKNLFVAMARQGVCIEAEGPDDAGLWGDLEAQAHKHEQAQQPQEPRKPLTEDQIYTMYSEPCSDAEMVEFAREVERHHGIGEADHG